MASSKIQASSPTSKDRLRSLSKAAQLPGLYLLPDIPQGPDAVEKGIFLMGDIGQFVFLIDYCFISFLQTGEGPPLGTAPPVCFCLRF